MRAHDAAGPRLLGIARTARQRLLSDTAYWRRRARQHGERAVFNCSHDSGQLEAVTRRQKAVLYPLLKGQLRGGEGVALDLGCGSGRFTPDLAEILRGRAIGVDPVAELIALAAEHPDVEYKVMKPGQIPLPQASADVVWICLVLGGIRKPRLLRKTVAEVERVLRPGGLLFAVENIASLPDARRWAFRSADEYCRLFPSIPLEAIGGYDDLGEPIAVFAGRRI
jgi:SAM-dependent methyltransferase